MAPHTWWAGGTRVQAALALCPSGHGHASAALWLPIPVGREGHVTQRHWPRVLVDADTRLRHLGSPSLVAARGTCLRGLVCALVVPRIFQKSLWEFNMGNLPYLGLCTLLRIDPLGSIEKSRGLSPIAGFWHNFVPSSFINSYLS